MARSNQGYWLDRQQELDKAMEKDEQALNKRLLNYYQNESNRLTREIASYYQRYGKEDVLEYRTMVEGLSDADKRLLYTDLNEFVQKYPQYADYAPISTSIYQLDRLQGLQASIQLQSARIGAYENEQLERHFSKQAKRYIDNSAKSLGFGDSFYTENPDIIRKVVYAKWNDDTDFSARIWNNRQKLTQTLQNDIASAIARGDSYDRISKQLAEKFERVNANNIRRLVFTEDTFVREQANKEVFGQDFEQYTLNVVQDGKTCDTCRALDGKVFAYQDATSGLNFPPLHPWCRCFATPKLPTSPEELDRWVDDYAHRHGDASATLPRRLSQAFGRDVTGSSQPVFPYSTIPNYNKMGIEERRETARLSSNDLFKYRYGKNGGAYQVNCQRCSLSYELRRRGYNVQARPKPKKPPNGWDFDMDVGAWRYRSDPKVFHDNEHSFLHAIKNNQLVKMQGSTSIYAHTELDGAGNAIYKQADIEARMKEFGDGARGIVTTQYTTARGHSGHAYNVENRGGQIVFIDSQCGKEYTGNYPLLDRAVSGTLTRVDNIPDSDFDLEFLEKAVKELK